MSNKSNTLHILLWVAQILLSVSLVGGSMVKLFLPADELAVMWPWTADNPSLVKLTGILDLLAGIGLVVPSLFRIRPRLTIFAAYGTLVLMIAAITFHVMRGEASQIGANIFFAILAAFIAWGRQTKVPLVSKGT
ncbi:DoxX family protein [Salmonirosea aquatica]|uniref:DoxX family protein n=1 Tax=Salmonirosea aquatica TaxID=2654236 RepID=A0A7C9FF60_9BACT|nr:DoxX family protein [Cytophagaceae bacterium SJW1-29]